jgi:hypothetical protein
MQSFISLAIVDQDSPDGLDHIVDVSVGQFRREGKGERPIGDKFRVWKCPAFQSTDLLIKGMKMERNVMDPCSDIFSMQGLKEFISRTSEAVDIQKWGIEMIGVPLVRRGRGR